MILLLDGSLLHQAVQCKPWRFLAEVERASNALMCFASVSIGPHGLSWRRIRKSSRTAHMGRRWQYRPALLPRLFGNLKCGEGEHACCE